MQYNTSLPCAVPSPLYCATYTIRTDKCITGQLATAVVDIATLGSRLYLENVDGGRATVRFEADPAVIGNTTVAVVAQSLADAWGVDRDRTDHAVCAVLRRTSGIGAGCLLQLTDAVNPVTGESVYACNTTLPGRSSDMSTSAVLVLRLFVMDMHGDEVVAIRNPCNEVMEGGTGCVFGSNVVNLAVLKPVDPPLASPLLLDADRASVALFPFTGAFGGSPVTHMSVRLFALRSEALLPAAADGQLTADGIVQVSSCNATTAVMAEAIHRGDVYECALPFANTPSWMWDVAATHVAVVQASNVYGEQDGGTLLRLQRCNREKLYAANQQPRSAGVLEMLAGTDQDGDTLFTVLDDSRECWACPAAGGCIG